MLIKIMRRMHWATSEMFDLMLGDNLSGRKNFIAENGYLYIDLTEIS